MYQTLLNYLDFILHRLKGVVLTRKKSLSTLNFLHFLPAMIKEWRTSNMRQIPLVFLVKRVNDRSEQCVLAHAQGQQPKGLWSQRKSGHRRCPIILEAGRITKHRKGAPYSSDLKQTMLNVYWGLHER